MNLPIPPEATDHPALIKGRHGIDWRSKRRHFLQVLAFALALAAVQYAFQPEQPLAPALVYTLLIATLTWAVIDLGRHFFPSSLETGWPGGLAGPGLVLGGIALGYLGGGWLAGRLCLYYGWYAVGAGPGHSGYSRTSLLISALAGLAGSFYFHSAGKSAYLERKMAEARRHATDARLKLLESQLEPHMLFNTLANLKALIDIDPPRAQAMLDHLIAYLRATLGASLAATQPLQAEFDRLGDYLELMAIRMGPRLAYTLVLPPELARHPVPSLLLQPLVENSIRHGLEPKVEGGCIRVSARSESGQLVLEVADTGVGLPPGSAANRPGFGLAQVRERLASLYGDAGAIELIAASAGGVCATARLPLKT
ncbi:MAG: histidine kinase family protein [Polaromonas sp.]|nr:histidine kinase family protein [Polaromonas sp.]